MPSPSDQPIDLARTQRDADTATSGADHCERTWQSMPMGPLAVQAEGRDRRYVLTSMIGQGATSLVYAATDKSFDREVAVKVLHHGGDGGRMARFLREARTAARLEHPNILPVHDLGFTADGHAFFAMRRVVGRSLGELLELPAPRPSVIATVSDQVAVLLKVLDALGAAHAKGIIHQDVKPDNIMIGDFGEVLLVDWGTAIDSARDGSGPHRVVGTPIYMAPEQARGERATTASDVYAAGATLFHLLWGRQPLWHAEPEEFWARKRRGDISAPTRSERSRLPRRLIAIVMKALAASPADRYADATALAQDLRRWQAGLTVSAHREGPGERAVRFAARRWRGLTIGVVAALAFAVPATLYLREVALEQARWGEPLLHETFDASWTGRWRITSGTAAARAGVLETTGPFASWVTLDRPVGGAVAIEFTGEIPVGSQPCDLSVVWCSGPVPTATTAHTIGLQFGAFDNSMALITNLNEAFGRLAAADHQLIPGQRHRLRFELDHGLYRMWCDGVEVLRAEDPEPHLSGWLSLYGYYPGKRFSDVTVTSRGLPAKIGILAITDTLLREGDAAAALAHAEQILVSAPEPELAAAAGYRRGLALSRLDRWSEAETAWRALLDGPQQLPAALALLDQTRRQGDWARVRAGLADLAQRGDEGRRLAALRWTQYLGRSVDHLERAEQLRWLELLDQQNLPIDPSLAEVAGQILIDQGRGEEALRRFRRFPRTACRALMSLHRYEEILRDYRELPFAEIEALFDLGRFEELIAHHGSVDWASIYAHAALGRWEALAQPTWARAFNPDARDGAVTQGLVYAAAGLGRPDLIPAGAATHPALRVAEGRPGELRDDPDPQMKMVGLVASGNLAAARAHSVTTPWMLPIVVLAEAASALRRGGPAQALAISANNPPSVNASATPFAQLTQALTPGLTAAAAGDRTTLRRVLVRLSEERPWTYVSSGGWVGRYALGRIDRAAFVAGLPIKARADDLARLAEALRAELGGEADAIHSAWGAWLDVPLSKRWFDYDPSLDAWASARLGR